MIFIADTVRDSFCSFTHRCTVTDRDLLLAIRHEARIQFNIRPLGVIHDSEARYESVQAAVKGLVVECGSVPVQKLQQITK